VLRCLKDKPGGFDCTSWCGRRLAIRPIFETDEASGFVRSLAGTSAPSRRRRSSGAGLRQVSRGERRPEMSTTGEAPDRRAKLASIGSPASLPRAGPRRLSSRERSSRLRGRSHFSWARCWGIHLDVFTSGVARAGRAELDRRAPAMAPCAYTAATSQLPPARADGARVGAAKTKRPGPRHRASTKRIR